MRLVNTILSSKGKFSKFNRSAIGVSNCALNVSHLFNFDRRNYAYTSSKQEDSSKDKTSSAGHENMTIREKYGIETLETRLDKLGTYEEKLKFFRADTQALARWLDLSIVKDKGRAYPDPLFIPADKAIVFPNIKGFSLNDEEITLPRYFNENKTKFKIVAYSCKSYGFSLIRSFLNPLIAKYGGSGDNSKVKIFEICIVEYVLLCKVDFIRTRFLENFKRSTDPTLHGSTFIAFVDVFAFASQLFLPSKYTGYVFLLDAQDRVRWIGSGEATESDLEDLYRYIDAEDDDINKQKNTRFSKKKK